MNRVPANWWKNIVRYGLKNDQTTSQQRDIFILNLLCFYSAAAYLLFFFILMFTAISNFSYLVFSNIFIFLALMIVRFFVHKQLQKTASNFLILAIYGGVFFYDNCLGQKAGYFFYYFPVLFATLTIFKWKDQKIQVLLYSLLPLLLIVIQRLYLYQRLPPIKVNKEYIESLFLFNLALAFILVVIYAIYVLSSNQQFTNKIDQSEKYLQTLIDNTEVSIWSINTNYQLTAFNKNFQSLLMEYYDLSACEGFDVRVITLHPNCSPKWKEFYDRAVAGESFNGEFFANNNYFELQVSPIFDLNGKLTGAAFHSRDVTARKHNEEKVQQIGINLKTLIDNTEGAIWSIDNEYKIIVFNKTFKERVKHLYDATVYEGFDVRDFAKYSNRPEEWQTFYDEALSGKSYIGEIYLFPEFYELQYSPILNVHGRQTGAAFYTQRITHKKQSEEALIQLSLNLQTLIDNTEGSIWSISREYKIIAANQLYRSDMRRIFNIEVTTGYDMIPTLTHPDYPKHWREQYERVFNGESFYEEYVFEKEDYELSTAPIRDINGKIVGAAFYARNITQRKENEKELISARDKAEEASRSKAQFLSNMSHELRTPLNGIIGFTNILLSEKYLPSQQQNLETLKYSSDHMLSLVDDILDFNKIEAGKIELAMEPFNLKSMLDKLAIVFIGQAHQKNLQFDVEIDPELNTELVGDITRLRQVLNNLLSNAIKFTNRGFVKLVVKIVAKTDGKTLSIRFAVIDTGIGIPGAKLGKVFESFTQVDARTTRKYGGTGLGLTISKRLVELMNGTLEVESIHGKGSQFGFEVIFESSNGSGENTQLQKLITDFRCFNNLEVLVAEDNVVNQMVAFNILKKWNIVVTNAENGQVALNYLKERKFDLVLMDLEMPVMDGLTAVSKIREFNTKIPIIALTAASFENIKIDLQKVGLNDFVQKPFRPEELYNKINKLVRLS